MMLAIACQFNMRHYSCASTEKAQTLIALLPIISGCVEQSVACVCVPLCVSLITFERNDFWPTYLARWLTVTLSMLNCMSVS